MQASYYTNQRPEMQAHVPPSAQRVLEIGCGAGGFMAGLKRVRTLHATGVEMSPQAAAAARQVFDEVIDGSVEQALPALQQAAPFDCIVANDVLEHLVDPWAVLRAVRPLLAPGGCVVASIPNVRHWANIRALVLHGRWDYQEEGLLDRTHLRFFTERSLPALFEPAGYRLVNVQGISGTRLPWQVRLLHAVLVGRLRDMRYLQLACVAVPA